MKGFVSPQYNTRLSLCKSVQFTREDSLFTDPIGYLPKINIVNYQTLLPKHKESICLYLHRLGPEKKLHFNPSTLSLRKIAVRFAAKTTDCGQNCGSNLLIYC